MRGVSVSQSFPAGLGNITVEAYAAAALIPEGRIPIARGPALGGRLSVDTAVDGLSFRVSGYQARPSDPDGGPRRSKNAWAVSSRYEHGRVDLQAEYGSGFVLDHAVRSGYVQAALKLTESWQAVTRFEHVLADTDRRGDDAFEEKRLLVGVAYALNRNFGLRIEQQFHRGYAQPVLADKVEAGAGQGRWTSSVVSLNYLF